MFTEMLRYIPRQGATCLVTLSLNSLKTKQVEISMWRGREKKGRIDEREKQGIGMDTITFLIY